MRRWFGALVLTLVTALTGAAAAWAQATPAIEVHKVDEGHFNPVPDIPVFILAIGIDGRPNAPGVVGDRGDALHLIGVNPKTHQATILNIPRDTYVPIEGHGSDKINAAYFYGGPQLEANTVAALTGARPAFVIVTGFDGFKSMIDEIGGVTVNVPFPMNDQFSEAHFPQGPRNMTGIDALAFSRNRHIDQGDIKRTEDQASVIIAALAKLHADSSAAGTIRDLGVLLRHTKLASGVGAADLLHLGRLGLSIDPAQVRNVTMPATEGTVGAADVVFAAPAAGSLFADFRDDAVLQAH